MSCLGLGGLRRLGVDASWGASDLTVQWKGLLPTIQPALLPVRRKGKMARKSEFWSSKICAPREKLCRKCVCLGLWWCAAFSRENAKTRKRENGQQNAKTRKPRKPRKRENGQQNAKTRKRENRENAKTRTEVQERESWTAMIISGSSGTSMQNNYIALQ